MLGLWVKVRKTRMTAKSQQTNGERKLGSTYQVPDSSANVSFGDGTMSCAMADVDDTHVVKG